MQLFDTAPLWLADGGLETTLIFQDKLELPSFAAFVCLKEKAGVEALRRYYQSYVDVAAKHKGCGIILETATWRASPDWAAKLGYSAQDIAGAVEANVALLQEFRAKAAAAGCSTLLSAALGPRGDGYVADAKMDVEQARAYHRTLIQLLASGNQGKPFVDVISAYTLNYINEAAGVALACRDAGIPCVISFTVETDGTLPSGEALMEAIAFVDRVSDQYPLHFLVNCAHPSHFASVLASAAQSASVDAQAGVDARVSALSRIRGLRCNASAKSHKELDESTELDSGDISDLAQQVAAVCKVLPLPLRVLGGCCGTDCRHVDAMASAVLVSSASP